MAYYGNHISQTVLVTNMSINTFISERVQPIINNWDIKATKKFMKSKTKEEQRQILINKVSEMSAQTKQLQYDSGNEGTNFSIAKPKEGILISDHMAIMTEEWQKRCKILKDQSAKRKGIPNLKHDLATLLHEIQRYLQYWKQNLTGSESMQQQRRTPDAQHIGTDWQQHHPQNVKSSTDRVEPPGQHTSEASLTKDKQQKLQAEISNLQMKYDSKVAENLEYKNTNSQHAADMDKMKEEMETIREELNKQVMINHQVAREKDEALNRLSEKAGQKLRNNNPAIMDLSTDNRPTKIAERFKELYTNQWTDAFTELTKKGCSETEAINILLGSVEDSFSLTASISEKQMKQLEHSAQVLAYIENTPNKRTEKMQSQNEHTKDKKLVQLSAECTHQLKQVLKASAPALVPEVQQKSVTPEETGQEKEPPVVQHGRHARQDERQLQHRRLSISPIIERRPSPQYRPQNAALIAEIKQQRRRPIIPLTTDRRLPMNPMFPNEPRTTDGYQPQHPPPPNISPTAVGRQQHYPPSNISPTAVGRQQQRNHPFETFTIDERQKLINESSNLRIKYDSAVAQSLEYKKRESEFAAEIDKMKEEMERIREELNKQVIVNHQVAREKDEALNRLSEIAGQKLRQNNPAITDLSTKNRPTKIAEGFKELYTNQWTDAFTELTENGWSDKDAIDILLRSLDDSFVLTANISEKQMKQLEHSAQMLAYIETTDEPEVVRQTRYVDKAKTLPIRTKGSTSNRSTDKMQTEHMGGEKPVPLSLECEDLLGQAFKASAPGLVSEVQQRFLKEKQVTVKFPEKNLQIAMTEFYKECAGITWLMNVQTPPMSLAPKPATGTQVQTDLYSFYTQSGEKVDYVVWPACLLHENGPLLTKGIVQPFKTGRRKRAKEEKENGRRETPE